MYNSYAYLIDYNEKLNTKNKTYHEYLHNTKYNYNYIRTQ